ncbi:MAG: diaminopimelate epimerase [Campylobacterota bacterium]|nr:diaminopimelate epimerase [Campylobacterota bacterium]
MLLAKYSASGNDFVIFHSFVKKNRCKLAQQLCDRQDGIGADGLIVLVPNKDEDFEWEFYNSDGSSAEMCGNGSRAAAHYAYKYGLASAKMSFVTLAGVIKAEVEGDMVQSDLTPPIIENTDIHVNSKRWWLVNTGVPHLITFDANIDEFDLQEARSLRETHNANVNIAAVLDDGSLRVRTYERGVEDETLACGTGMAAAYYRAIKDGLTTGRVKVFPRSGETLYLGFNDKTITFRGAVKDVFEAAWNETA